MALVTRTDDNGLCILTLNRPEALNAMTTPMVLELKAHAEALKQATGEIGVVIGKRARNVSEHEAWAYVEALVAVNDVSARDLQRSDGQWTRAKGFDSFCPVGVPRPLAEIPLEGLRVVALVNGEVRQDAPATDMVFPIPRIIAHISRIMTLEPGDLVATGTPDGVGPLQPGDVVEIRVAGVGAVSNPVVAEAS